MTVRFKKLLYIEAWD